MGSAAVIEDQLALHVRGLRKNYGDVTALRHLDLDIAQGSVLGLIGPNGAGKTTAVRCVAGLLKPDGGEVNIAPSRAPGGSPLAIAAQEIELYPGLPAVTNLDFFARLNGVTDPKTALAEVTEELGLEPLLRKVPKELSIGQQRLVHVAAALVARPNLLILDEPTAGLDIEARAALLGAVARRRAEGIAVLLSSHHLKDIEDVCDSVVLVDGGEAIASGRVDELVATYGGARVEVTVDGKAQVVDGEDVAAAITQVAAGGGRVESVNVIKPSLEAVFLTLTGSREMGPEEPA